MPWHHNLNTPFSQGQEGQGGQGGQDDQGDHDGQVGQGQGQVVWNSKVAVTDQGYV